MKLQSLHLILAATFVVASSSNAAITAYSNNFSTTGTWVNPTSNQANDVGTNIGTGTGSLAGWVYTNTGVDATAGNYAIRRDTSQTETWGGGTPIGDNVSNDGVLFWDMQNATLGDESITYTGLGAMTIGEQYTFSGSVFYFTGGSSFVNWAAQLVRASDGAVLATSGNRTANATSTGLNNNFSISYTALAGDDAQNLYLRFTEGGGNNNAIRDLMVDQVNLAVVPEPSVALLGGLGMLALLRRRRA